MKKYMVLLLLSSLLLLTACSADVTFEPTESGIFIRRDRHIVGAEVESFDNSKFDTPRYSDTELVAFVEDSVRSFNEEQAGLSYTRADELGTVSDDEGEAVLPVAIEKIEVADSVATLILDYKDSDSYLAFNTTSEAVYIQNLIVGTVQNGNDSNLTYDNMINAEDGTPADPVDIMDREKYMLAAIEGDTLVKVEGEIVYLTKDMTLVDENTARTAKGIINYIIFK